MGWTPESQPFGTNRAPLLTGLASDGSLVPVPVAVDPATGRLLTSTTGGGSSPTTIFNGKTTVTTAGTRVTLASSQAVQSITVKALAANTGTIYVGNATVSSSNGFQLAAGDSVSFDLSNLNTVNIDSSVNGEGVSYAAVN